MRNQIGKILLGTALVMQVGVAQAADKLSAPFFISTGAIPPYTINYKQETFDIDGFMGEIVIGALKKAGLEKQFSVKWAPWKRAQSDTQSTPNTIVFPLTRTEARENQYKWVNLMVTVKAHAFAIDPKVKIDTLDDLKKIKLGALAGSPPETEGLKILGADGPKVLEAVPDEDTNFKKLEAGRIQAWITQNVVAPYIAKKVSDEQKKPVPTMRAGFMLFEQPLWVAANKDTKDADIEVLKKALEDFKKDKAFKEILTKYGI